MAALTKKRKRKTCGTMRDASGNWHFIDRDGHAHPIKSRSADGYNPKEQPDTYECELQEPSARRRKLNCEEKAKRQKKVIPEYKPDNQMNVLKTGINKLKELRNMKKIAIERKRKEMMALEMEHNVVIKTRLRTIDDLLNEIESKHSQLQYCRDCHKENNERLVGLHRCRDCGRNTCWGCCFECRGNDDCDGGCSAAEKLGVDNAFCMNCRPATCELEEGGCTRMLCESCLDEHGFHCQGPGMGPMGIGY